MNFVAFSTLHNNDRFGADRTFPPLHCSLHKHTIMGLFKRKSEKDKLYDKHEKLLAKAHALATSNRAESDKCYAEADEIMKKIEALEAKA